MRPTRGRVVRLETVAALDQRLEAGARSLSGWRLRGLDLSGRSVELSRCRAAGATFIGCTFAPGDAERFRAAGALVVPDLGDPPVDPDRTALYTAAELYDTSEYAGSLDARAYAWSQRPHGHDALLASALHDQAIDEALTSWHAERHLVGVMGGHALERGEADYADAARLGHALGRATGADLTVATGGGPGAMEAVNLGARLAGRSPDDLAAALTMLTAAPSFRPSVTAWARAAFDVVDTFPDPVDTLGIPTWHYGHEPPNVFATAIAKYFRNSTREAILLEVCDAGIVFLPGAAGTVQEVFQDACENYYADESALAPMVLVGVEHWTRTVPAWPLLQALARGRAMEPHVHLVDTVDEAVNLVVSGT